MTGILINNGDRPDIVFENRLLYGGLHCGDCFEIYLNQWVNVRLEHSNDWIIIYDGKSLPICYGAHVQI